MSVIANMPMPWNISDLRCFMGIINQLRKFSRILAELTQLLHELISKRISGCGEKHKMKHLPNFNQN